MLNLSIALWKTRLLEGCSNFQFLAKLANAALSNGGPLSSSMLSGSPWHAKMDFMAAITGPAFVLLSRKAVWKFGIIISENEVLWSIQMVQIFCNL